uniref:Uncharacterized protein n=1 Tax=Octactis speculum TaxID=3111310 RepID=A0A7S2F1R8_9STRA
MMTSACVAFASARAALEEMPWFGVLPHWTGSVCLWHHVTKRPFPNQTVDACPLKHHTTRRRLIGHGRRPGASNSFTICPLLEAEESVRNAPSALTLALIARDDQLTHALEPILKGSSFAQAEEDLYHFSVSLLTQRMLSAADDLQRESISLDSLPKHLSAACFQRAPPDGFML